jgi:hypothetical protein
MGWVPAKFYRIKLAFLGLKKRSQTTGFVEGGIPIFVFLSDRKDFFDDPAGIWELLVLNVL